MQELSLEQVFGQVEEAFQQKNVSRVEALLWPALEQFPNIAQFWFYGGCVFFQTGRPAIAAQLFRKAIELEDSPHIYSNLGACLRRMNLHEEGERVLRAALDRDPDYAPALVNLGSMYVNEGNPQEGIPHLEKALAIGTERGAGWNLGLLYLEAARFGEGFDLYRKGAGHERLVRKFSADKDREPAVLPLDLSPISAQDKTLIVWGEQGIGDELMFGTILEKARLDFKEVILEAHPRLLALHQRAHPGMQAFDSRKEERAEWYDALGLRADYKCGIGDLAAIYRRSIDDFLYGREFNGGPPYRTEPDATSLRWRQSLLELADGRPIVGLATRGGVMQTARTYRTLSLKDVDALFTETDAMFVSFDYDDMSGFVEYVDGKFGEGRLKWFPSIVQHYDYHLQVPLLQATDMLVTVCQSIAHLAGGIGHNVRVLTPLRCAWRYTPVPGLPRESWYWWPEPNVRLYRQDDPESWEGPMRRVIDDIKGLKP